MRRIVLSALVPAAMAVAVPIGPATAIPVFDATNYAQNLLQAARALSQINNQIRSLQNEASMLTNMAKDLKTIDFPEMGRITTTLRQIDRLMGEAQGIDFKLDRLDAKFRALFPRYEEDASSDRQLADARTRLDTAMAAYRQTIGVQAQVVQNVAEDARTLSDLVARSQGAEGGLQAQQATNQLIALTAKQQFQLQAMMAAQFRSEAVEQARRVQAEQNARAATRRFLGHGKAYTPD